MMIISAENLTPRKGNHQTILSNQVRQNQLQMKAVFSKIQSAKGDLVNYNARHDQSTKGD
jgi:hypothetical protein